MEKSNTSNPVVQIDEGIIHPRKPRPRTVVVKKIGDYPSVPGAYLEIARSYTTPFFAGPPLCDELVALVQHLFSGEEAMIVRHLKPFSIGKTAKAIASAEHRPVEEVSRILERLANERFIIMSMGPQSMKRYFLIPMFPGVMENIMFRNSMDGLTDWHRRFAELFEKLFETGYMADYSRNPVEIVRYLPVGRSIEKHTMAWPSDHIEEILDRYKSFAVTYCQCRLTEKLIDRDCGKPLETCVILGGFAENLVRNGRMRRAEKQEVIDIKKNAEAHGLVTWMGNEDSGKGTNVSCSCCGCCCHNLRIMTEFNMPSMIAPPHFIPKYDSSKCVHCGKCAQICTMGAITVDTIGKNRDYQRHRCVGCGLCITVCDKKAIELVPAPDYKKPASNRLLYLARLAPGIIRNTLGAFKTHK